MKYNYNTITTTNGVTIEVSSPLEIGSSNPLDTRIIVANEAEIWTSGATYAWATQGDASFVYGGMIVYALDTKTAYMYVGPYTKTEGALTTNVTKKSNWRKLSASDAETFLKVAGSAHTDAEVATISASTKIHNNIISATTDGLLAYADLHYDENTNTLKFVNTNGYKELKLNGINFISGTSYDAANETIHIYTQEAGKTEPTDLAIPVSGLVSTFDAINGVSGNSQTGKIVGVVDSSSSTKLTVGANGFKLSKTADLVKGNGINIVENATSGTTLSLNLAASANTNANDMISYENQQIIISNVWDCGTYN